MDHSITALERAFQLAKSGECRSVDEIRKKLSSEGYYAAQVTGKGLQRQLQGIITAALTAKSAASERRGAVPSVARPKNHNGNRSAPGGTPVDRLNASNDG
jgi:hypothetical protein